MVLKKYHLILAFLFSIFYSTAQQTLIYTHPQADFDHAVNLYNNSAYVAAQEKFKNLRSELSSENELLADCDYYIANCAVRLEQPNADEMIENFVKKYPTSTKRNKAFTEIANYYYNNGKYSYAAKWFDRINTTNLSLAEEEEYNFKHGYSLFANKAYDKATSYFIQLIDSPTYGAQAKYYYGYIAYANDDYKTADNYLSDVANNSSFKTNVSYYLADMNFKLGNFEKAIEFGLPLLEKSRGLEHSEISKIVGESYFNLNQYENAIPHLKNYKGQRGKWNNTDFYILGYSYYKLNDYETAASYFNKIIDGSNNVAQNAYYHLGECYINLDKKSEALNAFRNAAYMDFDAEIKKDAWLNYAKLSYDIGNPYKNVAEVLIEFNSMYPDASEKEEINELIISAYINSSDYEGAISYLKNKKSKDDRILYQKVALFNGLTYYVNDEIEKAKENFENVLAVPFNNESKARATYWLANCEYQFENYQKSLTLYNDFISNNYGKDVDEFKKVYYNRGYAYLKLNDFEKSITDFLNYLSENFENIALTNDSYVRIGDAHFASSEYSNAITYYNKAINNASSDSDYAAFQIAISYGLTNQNSKKIDALNNFVNTFKNSHYTDNVLYELSNTYIKINNSSEAINTINKLIKEHPRSPLLADAMLKKGLVYYNNNENTEALQVYKNIVGKFPNTPEAQEAVRNARQIYVDVGNVDEYASWVKSIDFVTVTDSELDNDSFEAAEKQYLQQNYKRAIQSLEKYLSSFPNGQYKLKVTYYLANSLFIENEKAKALDYFNQVISFSQNEFTEPSLKSLSTIYLETSEWQKAIPILLELELAANSTENSLFAQSNLMKSYYELEQFEEAEKYAEKIISNSRSEDDVKSDATIIIARSSIKNNNLEKARKTYAELEDISTGSLKAEALYYKAYFENIDGSYRVSNEIIQTIASTYASHKYWAAKSLILMADNFYQLNDAFQATYILENVIANFSQFSDVVDEATIKLKKIKDEEAKTNESVKN